MNEQQIAKMKEIGSEWTSSDGSKHRIYFNDLPTLYGLKLEHYNSGNICAAWLDGNRISNTTARKILGDLAWGKLFYDFEDGKLHTRDVRGGRSGSLFTAIRAQIGA